MKSTCRHHISFSVVDAVGLLLCGLFALLLIAGCERKPASPSLSDNPTAANQGPPAPSGSRLPSNPATQPRPSVQGSATVAPKPPDRSTAIHVDLTAQPVPSPTIPTTRLQAGNTTLEVPEGSTMVIEHEVDGEEIGGTQSFSRSAESNGAELFTTAPEIAGGFDATAPQTTLAGEEGGAASGGDTSASFVLKGMKPSNPLFWIGGLLILVAGWLVFRQQITAALVCGGTAAVMIAIAAFPAFGLVLAVGALAIGVAVYAGNIGFRGPQAIMHEKAIRDVLQMIEAQPKDERLKLKSKASLLPERTKMVIKNVKKKYNLPSERD